MSAAPLSVGVEREQGARDGDAAYFKSESSRAIIIITSRFRLDDEQLALAPFVLTLLPQWRPDKVAFT